MGHFHAQPGLGLRQRQVQGHRQDRLCSTINGKNVTNLEVVLKNVIISSYSFSATGDQSPVPSETVTLNYTEIEWTYKKFDDMGNEAGNFPAKYSTQKAESV